MQVHSLNKAAVPTMELDMRMMADLLGYCMAAAPNCRCIRVGLDMAMDILVVALPDSRHYLCPDTEVLAVSSTKAALLVVPDC